MRQDLVILGEYNPDSETHQATDAAIDHSLRALNAELAVNWISTARINECDLLEAHGLWIAPGSPYQDFLRTLLAIRLARENLLPCLACKRIGARDRRLVRNRGVGRKRRRFGVSFDRRGIVGERSRRTADRGERQ